MKGPIRKMVELYSRRSLLRMHMPGHKGRLPAWDAALDVTEVPGTDSLYEPAEGIAEAEQLAARRWGARRSFLLVNGSTAGIQAMVFWAVQQGRTVLLPRDCHISAVHACALAGVQPHWVSPAWSQAEQTFGFDSVAARSALCSAQRPAFLSVYPNYFGCCADLPALARDCPEAALLTDEAHGAHFAFSGRLPADAGMFSTLWVAGAHKTLPAPTQTAFLHAAASVDGDDVKRLLRALTTTSPSYLLMMGLDDGRDWMETNIAALEAIIDACQHLRDEVNAIPGLRCWRREDILPLGWATLDPTRITVDVRGLGMTGWQAQDKLQALGVQAEMADLYRVVFIVTAMDGEKELDSLLSALRQLAALEGEGVPAGLGELPQPERPALTLRQAWLAPSVAVPLAQAIGRVAVEPFGAYPPGIALCMPGERITKEAIETAKQAQACGGSLFGVRDGCISVVK